jgi:glycosyltransferase involved in cell wall biosynthesis
LRTLLIDGWRGINHSYALVNQHQILRLAGMPDLRLFHRDMPFIHPQWNTTDNDPGFTEEERQIIDGLAEPNDLTDEVDAVYRICAPFRATLESRSRSPRAVTFMAVEFVFGPESFVSPEHQAALLANDDPIVTPSVWSRQRVIEGGFQPGRVEVVPLGVDAARFTPLQTDARNTIRARLGVGDDEFLFLNIAAPVWYKGIDLLLCAFGVLRQSGYKVRLLIKDQSALYGVKLESVIAEVGTQDQRLRDERVLSGIATIPNNLTQEELSNLFGIADCYVAPYRAEGFNLPVLEAIACGVPTIVTAGGATDDYCDDTVSISVPGRFQRGRDRVGAPTAYIEPDFAMLVDAMIMVARGSVPDRARSGSSREGIVEKHNWSGIASNLVRIAFDDS